MEEYGQKRLLLYLTKEQHQSLKSYCKSLGITMNGLIKVLIDQHIREAQQAKEGA